MLSEGDSMCGKAVCQWQQPQSDDTFGQQDGECKGTGPTKQHSWSKSSSRGRHGDRRRGGGGGRWLSGRHHHHHHHHHQQHPHRPPRRFQRTEPRDVLSLRPVNVEGNRVKGMRAPKNTNQFLMHEKYQLMHMRSDSIGTDTSSGSDSDVEFTDMDSYLGVLENARGALLDSPHPILDSPLVPLRVLPLQLAKRQLSLFAFGDCVHQEESMQYFPSEDDVLQSEDFMQKDFIEFCHTLTEHTV